jgi:hypothetical protein
MGKSGAEKVARMHDARVEAAKMKELFSRVLSDQK